MAATLFCIGFAAKFCCGWIRPIRQPSRKPSELTLGLRALAMAEVILDGVFVQDAARLGEDAGADVQRIVDPSRVALSAIMSGLSRAELIVLTDYGRSLAVITSIEDEGANRPSTIALAQRRPCSRPRGHSRLRAI